MNELVYVKRNDAFTDSKIISEATNIQNQSMISIIRKHKKRFERFGKVEFVDFKSTKSKRGRPEKVCLLNEPQATLLITFLANNDQVADFKTELVRQFYKMRLLLMERKTEEWKQTRLEGKTTRRTLTDQIQRMQRVAEEQGSKHAGHYYHSITKLCNDAAGVTDRGLADRKALNRLQTVEEIIADLIGADLEANVDYHDIYQHCKTKARTLQQAFA